MKTKLTPRSCSTLPAPVTGKANYHDVGMPGLALVVTCKGARSWYRIGRVAGKVTFLRLGAFPAVSLADARRAAAVINGRIAAGLPPRDPIAADEPTLADLFAEWHTNYAVYQRKHHEADRRRFERHCGPIEGLKLSAIATERIRTLCRDIADHSGFAESNHVLGLLRALPWPVNPCKGVKAYGQVSRDRRLLDSEIPRFFAALEAEPQDYRDFFTILLYTGIRRGNLQAARWGEFSLADSRWRVPMTKNGKPVEVHLSPPAVEILSRRLTALLTASDGVLTNGEFVFPPRIQRGNLAASWKRIVTAAGLDNFHVHDLRRSLASIMVNDGTPINVVAKVLGHGESMSSTLIYARLAQSVTAEAVNRAAEKILAAAQP